jgi:hypothetical protein
MSATFLTIAALALLAATSLDAGERVAMRVTPMRALEPATVTVTAIVERDAQNRAMDVEVDSSDFYRSSLVMLEGESAPRTTSIEFRGLPGGQYEVRVILVGPDGRPRGRTFQDLDVIANR